MFVNYETDFSWNYSRCAYDKDFYSSKPIYFDIEELYTTRLYSIIHMIDNCLNLSPSLSCHNQVPSSLKLNSQY